MEKILTTSQMEFLHKFLTLATDKNAEIFASFLGMHNPCGKFKIDDLMPIKCKILAVLVKKNTRLKQKIVKHISLLHDCYYAFEPISNTLKAKHKAINDLTFTYNELSRGEYNKFLTTLLNSIKENKFYYSLTNKSLFITYLDEDFNPIRYLYLSIIIKKNKRNDSIYINKVKLKLGNGKVYKKFKNNGLKKTLALHEQIVSIIKETCKDEACCFCNRIYETKHKCQKCAILTAKYSQLRELTQTLPQNLAQIIKRVQQKTHNKLNLSSLINKKIISVIERHYKKQDEKLKDELCPEFYRYRSESFKLFKQALDISFPAEKFTI